MTGEAAFIDAVRAFALDDAARALCDDAAVLPVATGELVLTHDIVAEGVHYLPHTDPADVAWKLVAVNLSDLAAKGAIPVAVLLGYCLGKSDWDAAFAEGLRHALDYFDTSLIGGDTVRLTENVPRVLGLTAIGRAPHSGTPSRGGAKIGDTLWVTGTIGDAGAGLALCREGHAEPRELIASYLRPRPCIAEGQAIAPHVSAMMDISDGLLIDVKRMADASRLAVAISLDAVPLSSAYVELYGADRDASLSAAVSGDDYELLFALPAGRRPVVPATRIGTFRQGAGIALTWHGDAVALPHRLGFTH